MAAGVYEDWQAKLPPTAHRAPNSEIVERALGAEKDEQQDRVRQATLVSLPDLAPTDALDFIGAERLLPRESGESDVNYAERLRAAWESTSGWSYAGSHGSLLRALKRAGFPSGTPSGAHVIQRTRRYTYLDGGGNVVYGTHPGWTFDISPPSTWNQFGIVFGADVSGLTSGSSMADRLNALVRQWKPAKARFMGTWIIVSGPTWDWPIGIQWNGPGLAWGDGVTTGVTRIIPP